MVINQLKSAKSATIMFDECTDKHQKILFMRIRTAIIDDNWELKLFMLSSTSLESHTAKLLKTHIREVINEFVTSRIDQKYLYSVHDGTANMLKASKLLKIEDPQHCLGYIIHSLSTVDGFNKVPSLSIGLMEMARNIVTCLSFKAYALSRESLFNKINTEMLKKLQALSDPSDLLLMDE